jgi:hypothetical protein
VNPANVPVIEESSISLLPQPASLGPRWLYLLALHRCSPFSADELPNHNILTHITTMPLSRYEFYDAEESKYLPSIRLDFN